MFGLINISAALFLLFSISPILFPCGQLSAQNAFLDPQTSEIKTVTFLLRKPGIDPKTTYWEIQVKLQVVVNSKGKVLEKTIKTSAKGGEDNKLFRKRKCRITDQGPTYLKNENEWAEQYHRFKCDARFKLEEQWTQYVSPFVSVGQESVSDMLVHFELLLDMDQCRVGLQYYDGFSPQFSVQIPDGKNRMVKQGRLKGGEEFIIHLKKQIKQARQPDLMRLYLDEQKMRTEVIKQVKNGTLAKDAKMIMERNGFSCRYEQTWKLFLPEIDTATCLICCKTYPQKEAVLEGCVSDEIKLFFPIEEGRVKGVLVRHLRSCL